MTAEAKIKVRFLRNYEVKDHRAGTKAAERYEASKKAIALPAAKANHFVRLGVAAHGDE